MKTQAKNLIKALSLTIAKTNKPFLLNQMNEEFLKRNMKEQFNEIILCTRKKGVLPYKDEIGRITFFKVKIGDKYIPIY